MSLKDTVEALFQAYDGDYGSTDEILGCLDGMKMVHSEISHTTRWGHVVEEVWTDDDQFVSISYEQASGDGDCEFYPDVVLVRPEEHVITRYVAVL